jgi:VanZ family protein
LLERLEKNKKWLVYFPLVIYWLVLFTATTLPARDLPKTGVSDKIEHFSAYLILAILLNLSLMFQNKYPILKKKAWLFTLIFSLLYAGLDEIHQYFIPGRDCDILDWLSDSAGILLGLGIVRIVINYFRYKPQME